MVDGANRPLGLVPAWFSSSVPRELNRKTPVHTTKSSVNSEENTRASCSVTSTLDLSNVDDRPRASRTSAKVSTSVSNLWSLKTRNNRRNEYVSADDDTNSGRKLTKSTTFNASSGNL